MPPRQVRVTKLAPLLLLVCATSHAALLSRAGGQAVYDSSQNITWLADADLAFTNTFGVSGVRAGGYMSWSTAGNWIAAMNSAAYLGVSDWRLPTTAQPDPTCASHDGLGNGYGFGCRLSEMGHLYNVDGVTAHTPGLFSNVQFFDDYWSGTPVATDPGRAWEFFFPSGYQISSEVLNSLNVWAVRPGDIALVPIPPATFLYPSALGLLGWRRRGGLNWQSRLACPTTADPSRGSR